MQFGVILTVVSSIFLALTMMADKLMVGDFYQNNPKLAWVISSVAGSTIGLLATILLWLHLGLVETFTTFIEISSGFFYLGLYCVLAGILSTLTLRCYFKLMSEDMVSASVSIAVASTPIFIFLGQVMSQNQSFTIEHLISFLIAISGLVFYEYISNPHVSVNIFRTGPFIVGVILLGTAYVLLLDEIFIVTDSYNQWHQNSIVAILLPYYWLGLGLGFLYLFQKDIKNTIVYIFKRKKFIYIVLILETIGAGFFFFEFFGLSKISATLVALIIGAHVIFVWLFDLYISYAYHKANTAGKSEVQIHFFKVPTINLTAYNNTKKTHLMQFLSIILVLVGLWFWPEN